MTDPSGTSGSACHGSVSRADSPRAAETHGHRADDGSQGRSPGHGSQSRGTRVRGIVRRLVVIQRSLATLMLSIILLTMGSQVIARYLFDAPFSWSEEVARLAMIWLTFLAAAYVMAEGGHITVDLWSSRVSPPVRLWLDGLVCLVVAATCLLLFFGGLRFVWYVHPVGSPSLNIPKSLWYGAVSVGLLLMAIHSVLNMVLLVRTGEPLSGRAVPEEEGFHLELTPEPEGRR